MEENEKVMLAKVSEILTGMEKKIDKLETAFEKGGENYVKLLVKVAELQTKAKVWGAAMGFAASVIVLILKSII